MKRFAIVGMLAAGCGRVGFESTGGDGGDAGDDATPVDGAPAAACPSTIVVADDFAATTPSAAWTVLAGSNLTVTQGGGRLRIAYGNNVPAGQTAGYQLAMPVDLTGACVTVELVTIPNISTVAHVQLQIGTGTQFMVFTEQRMMLKSYFEDGNVVPRIDTRAYDPAAQRFLRLHHTDGRWSWEVSADDVTYLSLGSSAMVGAPITNVVGLTASSETAVSNGGEADFGPVRIVVPP